MMSGAFRIFAIALGLSLCSCAQTRKDVANLEAVTGAAAEAIHDVTPVVQHVQHRVAQVKAVVGAVKAKVAAGTALLKSDIVAGASILTHADSPAPAPAVPWLVQFRWLIAGIAMLVAAVVIAFIIRVRRGCR